jgi:hypothetical protein
LVLTVVDFVESDEELEVLAQELEQISELFALGNVVVAMGCLLRGNLLCRNKSSH